VHSPPAPAEVFDRVGTLLSTSFNSGVSIEVVRRRLGHASTETTQVYALLADKVADAEIRAARRRRDNSAS
jgi:integrase